MAVTAEQTNALMALLKAHADELTTPEAVYEMFMHAADVVGQRAHELVMSHSQDTRDYEWAIQVSKDTREASENAERMMSWIENEKE